MVISIIGSSLARLPNLYNGMTLKEIEKKIREILDEDSDDDKELARQRIYEPDGGTSSASDNTVSSDGTHN
jgi:hypothetical protein